MTIDNDDFDLVSFLVRPGSQDGDLKIKYVKCSVCGCKLRKGADTIVVTTHGTMCHNCYN